ncbi:hypothetical protein RhiirC2_866672 [Rhizophagus irregularis]|uniref:Uncharacterized protein n=1 Tax=Rhizophagus irregularis TaxID=588596 RepID=A0A2N1N6Z7_9GLOM|nr:hypothetical protein RhiirC2_866672 [Rhizophagus irregularis]
MAYISDRKEEEGNLYFLLCETEETEGVRKEAEEMLKVYPEIVESYEKLNKSIKTFSTNSKIMPNTYQSLIENCLDEEHYTAALDLLDSFQNEQFYPPKLHIRKMMEIIVNPKVDKDINFKSYKILQHVLYTTGSIAFENIWNFENHSDPEEVWPVGYDSFWAFIKDKFNSLTQNIDDNDQSTRILLFLEQIVNVFEIDMRIKQRKFFSSILLRLVTRSRTNLRIVIDSLITSVFSKEIPMEAIRLSQRLLDQIIILSYAGHICRDSLKNEMYLQINLLEPSRMISFLQTLLSNTFKYQLIEKALLDSDLSNIKKEKKLILSSLSLVKITKIFLYSIPYTRNLTEPVAIWRHIFFYSSILQSYVNAKTLRQEKQGKVVIVHGLDDEEMDVVADDLISKRLKDLKKWLKQKDMGDLKDRSELLLEMMDADAKQIKIFVDEE